jgi:6-phosphofructokinase 1
MGRSAGWLAYGVAIAGEAHLVMSVEDIVGDLAIEEGGEVRLAVDRLADRIVDLILARERRGKLYGTVVLAEGLAEMLPEQHLCDVPRDEHGHVSLGRIDIAKLVAGLAAKRYGERAGRSKRITGVQLGYESRCSPPHAFDVMLGSQLGLGAFYALAEKELDGYMVSVAGQFELRYVPFQELIDPRSLRPPVRYIDRASGFHRLAADLGTKP